MKVLGIGLPKTGTTSLHRAFQILGYDSVHCPLTWEEMISHEAATDSPAALWWERAYWEFPECKFVLTVRLDLIWLESCEKHFSKPAPASHVHFRWALFKWPLYNREAWWRTYGNHNAEIFGHFKERPDRLLVISICDGDGWGLLCKFLGKPIPDVPFPHENRTDSRSPA